MNRKLIYCPDVCTQSFVLLLEKGDSGESWSIRDYSQPGRVTVRHAREFLLSLQQVKQGSTSTLDAPVVSTSDLTFWHTLIFKANAGLGLPGLARELSATDPYASDPEDQAQTEFEILDREHLMKLPKAKKAEDMRRLLKSPNSDSRSTLPIEILRFLPK